MAEQQAPVQTGPTPEDEAKAAAIIKSIVDQGATVFFEKALTASDTAGSGRVVIPKAIAEEYFPRLEMPSGTQISAYDTRGHEYKFKFRFWVNNQSRMYLLEGAGELHRQFAMSVGDVMVFAQKEDKTFIVAGRPATANDVIRKAPVKRSAGEPRPRGSSKDGGSSKGAKPPKGQAAGAGSSPQEPKRKRARPGGADTIGLNTSNVIEGTAEPAVDGIFRAVPMMVQSSQASCVAAGKNGRWVVTLNLAGELYQAYFDTQEDANEAFNAAGAVVKSEGTAGPASAHDTDMTDAP